MAAIAAAAAPPAVGSAHADAPATAQKSAARPGTPDAKRILLEDTEAVALAKTDVQTAKDRLAIAYKIGKPDLIEIAIETVQQAEAAEKKAEDKLKADKAIYETEAEKASEEAARRISDKVTAVLADTPSQKLDVVT